MRPTTRSTGIAGLVALFALLFSVFAIPASAGIGGTVLPLHNDTADVEDDCPDTENAYWHFVLTPNNDTLVFEEIELNLDGEFVLFSGDDIIPGGNGQLDNIFVMVPDGFALDDLIADGSEALVSGEVRDQSKFVLSHVCEGETPDTTDTTPPQAETTTPSVAPQTQTQGTRPAAVAGAVQAQPQFTG